MVKDIKKYISLKEFHSLKRLIEVLSAPDLADILLELNETDRFVLFRILPRDLASEVFALLDPKYRDEIILSLSTDETKRLLADLRPDDRTELFDELPGQVVQRLLNLLSPEDLAEAKQLLGYPPESVGRIMTPDYIAVRSYWTVERGLRHVRSMGQLAETINDIYVVDDSWVLLDALEIRKLILAEPDQRIEELMDHRFVCIRETADREQAVQLIQRYNLDSLPVVDSSGVLLGIVTVDDIMDVAEKEVTEDFHKSAAIAPLHMSYRDLGVTSLYSKRVTWLLMLVILNLVSSGIIASFEKTLASVIALAYFIPLLIDTGGNVGSQSATIIIRSMATGDIKLRQWLQTLTKEILVGASLGITLGVSASVVGLYRGGWKIGLVVGISMFLIVVFANLVGTFLPFLLARMRLDPATASSPLVTTLADILGLAIYFSVANLLLNALRAL
ncbi:MAG: magnesium transporter [Actinobacteria bacterium]|nr:magnesium transporter [Actinomycetota bacterium]